MVLALFNLLWKDQKLNNFRESLQINKCGEENRHLCNFGCNQSIY